MGLIRLTTTPTILDIADLRDHLRIDGVQDDAAIGAMQRAAVDYVERQTRTQIGTGTYRLTLDGFPPGREIRIPRPPLKSVEAVKYMDAEGALLELWEGDDFTLDADSQPGRIVLAPGKQWPATDGSANSVIIEFTAGHEAGEEPDTIKHLIRLIVGAWFECREGATDRRFDEIPLPFAVTALLEMHRFIEVV